MRDHLQYLLYVLKHKFYVFLACQETNASLWSGLIHDWSKFTPGEWFAYVKTFYAPDGTKKGMRVETEEFNQAWNLHQKRQPHHWQHFSLLKDNGKVLSLEMPEKYVREMVADWIGAGWAITGKREVKSWYEKNKEKMTLHPNTRVLVERILSQVRE